MYLSVAQFCSRLCSCYFFYSYRSHPNLLLLTHSSPLLLCSYLVDSALCPAIDLEGSVSRAMYAIVPKLHLQSAQRRRQLVSAYRQQRDLIAVGAYQKGSDPRVDEAIARWPDISAFLQQSVDERSTLAAAVSALDKVLAVTPGVRT